MSLFTTKTCQLIFKLLSLLIIRLIDWLIKWLIDWSIIPLLGWSTDWVFCAYRPVQDDGHIEPSQQPQTPRSLSISTMAPPTKQQTVYKPRPPLYYTPPIKVRLLDEVEMYRTAVKTSHL